MEVPFVGLWKTCNLSNFLVEVVVPDFSRTSLVNRRQLDQVHWWPWCDRIVGVQTSQLAQSMIFLKLDHEVLGSNWGTLVPLVPELNGTSKALKLVSSKEQVNLIREKGCSVFEQPVICLAKPLEVSNEPKNQDRGWSRSAHLPCCPETSVFEEQVNCISNMGQVVDPAKLSMPAVQSCDLVGQVSLPEVVPESPVEFPVAFLPVNKSRWKILVGHFDLGVPLLGSLVRVQGFRCHRRMCQARFA